MTTNTPETLPEVEPTPAPSRREAAALACQRFKAAWGNASPKRKTAAGVMFLMAALTAAYGAHSVLRTAGWGALVLGPFIGFGLVIWVRRKFQDYAHPELRAEKPAKKLPLLARLAVGTYKRVAGR